MIFFRYWTNWATGWISEPVSQSPHRFTHLSGFLNYSYNSNTYDQKNVVIFNLRASPRGRTKSTCLFHSFICADEFYFKTHIQET
jgi:hypothetical protein